MVFRKRGRTVEKATILLQNELLQIKNSVKYLGVMLETIAKSSEYTPMNEQQQP